MLEISKKNPPRKTKESVIGLVNTIPIGKVVTYGMIANQLGIIARTVGWVMASISENDMMTVPWQRVVGHGGSIPALKYGLRGQEQIRRLEEEGFVFKNNKIVMSEKNTYFF